MTVAPQKLVLRFLPPVCVVWLAIAPGGQAPAQQTPPTQNSAAQSEINFNHDIAPILYRTCARCHRPGEAGPFSLLTYADAKSHARQIAAVTKTRFMPPWLPENGDLKFADDLRLSEDEIARIQAWGEQGALEGNPKELPAKPTFVEGWQLGKPDVIVTAAKAYALPASGSAHYWNFVVSPPVGRARSLERSEVCPRDK